MAGSVQADRELVETSQHKPVAVVQRKLRVARRRG